MPAVFRMSLAEIIAVSGGFSGFEIYKNRKNQSDSVKKRTGVLLLNFWGVVITCSFGDEYKYDHELWR